MLQAEHSLQSMQFLHTRWKNAFVPGHVSRKPVEILPPKDIVQARSVERRGKIARPLTLPQPSHNLQEVNAQKLFGSAGPLDKSRSYRKIRNTLYRIEYSTQSYTLKVHIFTILSIPSHSPYARTLWSQIAVSNENRRIHRYTTPSA